MSQIFPNSMEEVTAGSDRVMNKLYAKHKRLRKEWNASPQKSHLIKQLHQDILPNKEIFIDSAVCLGLGSIEETRSHPLHGYSEKKRSKRYQKTFGRDPDERVFEPVGSGKKRNRSLYQLIIFETVLECLRERFTIDNVRFQEPLFTEADQLFLETRGHSVVPTPDDDIPDSPVVTGDISGSTLLFAPYLPCFVVLEAVCLIKPALYLGNDLFGYISYSMLWYPEASWSHLMEHLEEFVFSREFAPVPALGNSRIDLGFMWQANLDDEAVQKTLQLRKSFARSGKQRVTNDYNSQFITGGKWKGSFSRG